MTEGQSSRKRIILKLIEYITIKFLSIKTDTFMPSVFVGQDCKYDRNFEALPVKEYLTQVGLVTTSYGAPEGSCETLRLIAFPRNTIAFSRNIILFSRNRAYLLRSLAI